MAYQRKTKNHGSGQKTTTTTTSERGKKNGFRTTFTTKQGPVTQSQSRNQNGSIRTTTTSHINGVTRRSTSTTPSAPKIKHKKPSPTRYKKMPVHKFKKQRKKKAQPMGIVDWAVAIFLALLAYDYFITNGGL